MQAGIGKISTASDIAIKKEINSENLMKQNPVIPTRVIIAVRDETHFEGFLLHHAILQIGKRDLQPMNTLGRFCSSSYLDSSNYHRSLALAIIVSHFLITSLNIGVFISIEKLSYISLERTRPREDIRSYQRKKEHINSPVGAR